MTPFLSSGTLSSPGTDINLPAFSLPAPAVNGMAVQLRGAVEAQNSNAGSQTVVVDVKSYRPYGFDPVIAANMLNVAHPLNKVNDIEVWDGLLIPFSDSFNLWYDASGNVAGNYGDSNEPHPYIYQYINGNGAEDSKSPSTHL